MKKILLLLLFVLVLSGCGTTTEKEVKPTSYKVDCNNMKFMVENENAVLIDVRSKEEYDEKHLDNAINIPLDRIDDILKQDIKFDNKIIVYCFSGKRSGEATKELLKLGFLKVYDLGAMSACENE